MKHVLFFFLMVAPVSPLFAQGIIVFGNVFGSGFNAFRAPLYGPDPNNPFQPNHGNSPLGLPAGTQTYAGAPLTGTGYTVALFTLSGDSYVEIYRISSFLTGSGSGLFLQRTATDPNHPPASTVTAVVRAWDNKGGTITNWDQALAEPAVPIGQSDAFTVERLGGGVYSPPSTVGLRSFNLYHRGGAFISAQPEDLIVPAGASAQMHVEVFSDLGAPSYQWQRDGADVTGATGATLSLTNVQHADAGGYSAVVTVSSLTLTSRVARLSVQPMIVGISHLFIPEWGADAFRLTYDSTPQRPVRIEVRSTLQDAWINMGQFVNPTVRSFFFDIGPTNDMRFYRLSIDP